MVEATPSSAFEMSEPDLLLEFLIVAFNAPTQFGNINKRRKLDVFRQGREPVFGRLLLALGPLDQQPFLRVRFGKLLVAVRRANAQAGEARGERRGGAVAPTDGLPRRLGLA
jgi:hypothetical protein